MTTYKDFLCSIFISLHWRHSDHDGVSNHQPHGCLLNRLFRRRSKKASNPRHWPLCGEFTGTGEIPAQRASYAENVSIWWRHRVIKYTYHEIKQVPPNYLKIQPAIANYASVWKEASLVVVLDIINGLSARLPSTYGGEITEDSFTGNFVNKIWLIVIFYHGNLFLDEKSLLL